MNSKVLLVKEMLWEIFQSEGVEYKFENELHKFRIERKGPSHWLYVERTFLEDSTDQEILRCLNEYSIVETLKGNLNSVWLALTGKGLLVVNDDYGRGHYGES